MRGQITSAAVVSIVDPYPADSGSKVVLAGFLDFLLDRLGATNVHYVLVGGRRDADRTDFPVVLHELAGPRTTDRVLSVLTRSTTGRGSVQESMVHSRAVAAAVDATLRSLTADLEIFDTVRTSQFAGPGHNARRVCYLDDLFSERYRLMLGAMRRFPGVDMQPLGTFAHHVPALLRPIASSIAGQRALLSVERRLVRRSEDLAARAFDTCLLVNPGEAKLLRARAGVGPDRVQSVPPLVAEPAEDPKRDYRGAADFVFLGKLSQPHNEDGLRSFLVEVWPEMLRHRADARLRVIGRAPRPALRAVIDGLGDTVSLEGFVPDLDAALSGAAAMVNPLRFGTGIKIKIMEALARALPVVSTSVGADGVDHGPGTGVLVSDNTEHTVQTLLGLTDTDANRLASAAAVEHFRRRYARPAAFASYDRAFGLA